jgi:hypothetical protein
VWMNHPSPSKGLKERRASSVGVTGGSRVAVGASILHTGTNNQSRYIKDDGG